MSQVVRRLDTKAVVGNFKKIVEGMEDGEQKELYHLIGKATEVKTGNGTYGLWVGFVGEFQAVPFDAETGEVGEDMFSDLAFLPDPYEGLVHKAMRERAEGEIQEIEDGSTQPPTKLYKGLGAVEIALTIGIVKDSSKPTGYMFVTKSLQDIKVSSSIDHLTKLLPTNSAPKLEAKEPTRGTGPSPTPKKAAKK